MDCDPLISNPRARALLADGRFDEAMREPLHARSTAADPLRAMLSRDGATEDGAFAGMTVGELIYDYVHLNPMVLAAAEFSHRDVDGLFSFAVWAGKFDDVNDAAGRGAVNGLQGYVGEELMSLHLEEQGFTVEAPAAPNNPEFDRWVDGEKFQMKTLGSMSGVHEHFRDYTCPMIVNADLAEQTEGMHNVFVDYDVHRADVRDMVQSNIVHGHSLAEGHVPWISFLASSPLPLYRLYKRETDLVGAVTVITTNTGGRLAGGSIGGKSGAVAGAMLFGPAGAVIGLALGSIAGSVAGRQVAGVARRSFTRDEEDALRDAAATTATLALEALPMKRGAWERKRSLLADVVREHPQARDVGSYVARCHDENWTYMEHNAELLDRSRSEMRSMPALIVWQRTLILLKRSAIHPYAFQAGLAELNALAERLIGSRKRWMVK
jgi:hypothetical protein